MNGDEADRRGVIRRGLEEGPGPTLEGSDSASVVYRAVWAWSGARLDEAAALIAGCEVGGPYRELVAALRAYFSEGMSSAAGMVYRSRPEAFAAYIRGGGNVELYAHLTEELRALYRAHRPAALLDVGPGDGQALAGTWRPELGAVDLVEPATALLADAAAALDAAGVVHRDHPTGIEEFLDEQPAERRWPMVQATFSLQSLTPAARGEVLARLAGRCDRLVLAEFDVPTRHDPFEPARFLRCLARVEQGLREYGADPELVARGFLIPTMLGFFDPAAPSNHEQPMSAWAEQLHTAGFALVETPRLLWDYWWAPAYLLHAVPRSRTDPPFGDPAYTGRRPAT